MLKFLINLIPISSLRKKLRKKYLGHFSLRNFEINNNTKCLIVAPHPDDEVIGCGGILAKYASHFDVICMSSAGVAFGNLSAKERNDLRLKEFDEVMTYLGINNHWIFETYGKPMFIDKIDSYFNEYAKVLDFEKYDYIFLPYPNDNHPEHQHITKNVVKKLLKTKKVKPSTQIMYYEVWTPIQNPNLWEDISEQMDEKIKLIKMYKSQIVDGWDYDRWAKGLALYRGMYVRPHHYAEVFEGLSLQKYLRENK